ncbi:hypothetical protein Rs2_33954 [Raphanus sativus]|nr:hypothetical protein Rs2_33954 [Raphanus sativus]
MRGLEVPPRQRSTKSRTKKKKKQQTLITPPSTTEDPNDVEARAGRSLLMERSHARNTNRTSTARKVRRREQKPNVHREESVTPIADGNNITKAGRRAKIKAGPTVAVKSHTVGRI